MRLALLIGHFPPGPFGGAELQAEEWASRLGERHAVTVITRRDPPDQPEREDRGRFQVVRTPLARLPLWRTVADVVAIERAVASLAPPPELLLCFQTFVSGLAGVRLQGRRGLPAVVWVRGESEYRLGRSSRHRWISPWVWERARGVLVQSETNRAELLRELGRVRPGGAPGVAAKLRVVPNGITLPPAPVTAGDAVLTLGRLIPEKGVDLVIHALAGFPGARLLVAGTGPERARLEALARARGVAAEFLGFVPRERLGETLARARCVALAARAGEGFPNALLEAMAWGVPVAATPVAGVRDLVRDGANGLLVPPNDATALRAALKRLLTDSALRARLVAAGRETAAAHAWERVTPRLEELLRGWGRA
jgi:glycosyltransferase involved in cell wall biosynthesis